MLCDTVLPGTSFELIHRFNYNTNGTMQSDSIGSGSVWRKTSYTYESDNVRLETVTDPLLHTTTYTYDSYGRIFTEKDYLNNTLTYGYDALGRQTSISSTDGSQNSTVYSWTGTDKPTLGVYCVKNTGNNGSVSNSWYDELGRAIRSENKSFNGTYIYTVTEYNSKGQTYRVSEPYFSGGSVTWNVYSYDNYCRTTGLTRPSGRNTSWSYSDSTVTETTAGKSFSRTYGPDGALLTASDNGGSITYTYLPDGNIKSITAPGSIVTYMKYDPAGNQSILVDPSAGTNSYTYNAFGELLTQQNGRGQTSTLSYYNDGRINQKTTPEGTTSYTYNENKQMIGVTSPGNIKRNYTYDTKGRISNINDTIDGSGFSTTFTYDSKGRLYTTTHPSGIVETNTYNSNGYLASISAGGATRWSTTSMNERQQITGGTYGSSLNVSYGYNSYGYPDSVATGSIQKYKYSFNPITGNLSWRKNVLQGNVQENFVYDNLERLDSIFTSSETLLKMSYGDSANITEKSDIGSYLYSSSSLPYAITGIDDTSGLVPSTGQIIGYYSFEKVDTIIEGSHSAKFIYNSKLERARMIIKEDENTILTRWYPTGDYMKETSGGATKEYTYIGGDAYTAPVVAVTQNGVTTWYYLLRDYLGNITHQVNTSNTVVDEWSYDAWGRLRNPSTLETYSPGSEPTLIAGRGFTGHEHLPWFNVINMNGRLYDPLVGMFMSPDNFVQMPDFSQNFNRYAYALNNPLKFTDPDGEFIHLIIGAIIGGTMNLIMNADKVDNFWEGLGYFGVGAAAGALSAGVGAGISSAMAAGSAAGGASTFAAGFWGTTTALPAASSFATGTAVGAGAGFTGGFLFGTGNALLQGQNIGEALWSGAKIGLAAGASGALLGGFAGGISAKIDHRNFWNGTTDDLVVDGWRRMPGGGWKAMPGERQGYYLSGHNDVIPSWRADLIKGNPSDFSTASARGMTIDFSAGSNGTFQFGNKNIYGLRNKAAYGLQLRITGFEQGANLKAFANNIMFNSTPPFSIYNNFAESFSWSASANYGPGKGSFTLLFFQ